MTAHAPDADPDPDLDSDPDFTADPTPGDLRAHERDQELVAREAAQDADTEEEARTELRRADKAHYLQEKLAEQEQADRESREDRG